MPLSHSFPGRHAHEALTPKERMLQKAEQALNERLATAAASLQSHKMHHMALDVYPPSPTKRQAQQPGFGRGFGRGGEAPQDPQFHRGLTMEGRQVPSSNERLGLILSDLMR